MTKFAAVSVRSVGACLLVFCANGLLTAADAQDPVARACLGLMQIRTSEVLDNQHILFTMNDGTLFPNNLPYACPGLRRDTAWLHRTSLNNVCDLDLITVLNHGGGGFMPGASCGLGRFEPVPRPQLESLRAQLKEAKSGTP